MAVEKSTTGTGSELLFGSTGGAVDTSGDVVSSSFFSSSLLVVFSMARSRISGATALDIAQMQGEEDAPGLVACLEAAVQARSTSKVTEDHPESL